MNKKLIRKSINSWNFSVLFVKKSIEWQMCIDYRILNAVSVKNKYSLFRIQDCLNKFDSVTHLIKFNLTTEYHQMKIANVDIFKTVFNTRLKKFEYTVMSFKLTNISIIFQIIINKILRLYLNKFVIVYLDDIVIFFNFIDKHRKHVQLIFNFFQKHQFFAKFTKCMLIKKQFMFCKHIVKNDVIKFC